MFDQSWGVDVSVSTPRIISAIVEEAVAIGDVVRLFSFNSGSANLVEVTLPTVAPVIGKCISEVELPEKVILAAIVRDREVFAPEPHDLYAEGDELIFVAPAEEEGNIKSVFIG
jgi:trk system potassium uptake protein TrkA